MRGPKRTRRTWFVPGAAGSTGRIGSGIASEVGSMKVTQQIDAVRALGTSPIKRIVIPRVVAALIALPILTLFADYIGLFGALMICARELNIHSEFFISKVVETLRMNDLLTGMAKTIAHMRGTTR